MSNNVQSLQYMVFQSLVDQIKALPPKLLEEVLFISLKQIREEITENITEYIVEKTEESVYNELEEDLPKIVRAEVVREMNHRHGRYGFSTSDHDVDDRIVRLGKDIAWAASQSVDRQYDYVDPTTECSDSEGSSGDYDYPDEESDY